jgi:hypothetical protein
LPCKIQICVYNKINSFHGITPDIEELFKR